MPEWQALPGAAGGWFAGTYCICVHAYIRPYAAFRKKNVYFGEIQTRTT